MKIAVVNGSPRGRQSNTEEMVTHFLAGATSLGATTTEVFLSEKNVKHCLGCFACWKKVDGPCVQKDDMEELLSVFESDILVFAFPLYVDGVPGLLKNFLDRSIVIGTPYFEPDSTGETRHVFRKAVPKFVILANCGFPEQSHFAPIHHFFSRVARNFHTQVVGEIYRGQGPLLKSRSKGLNEVVEAYFALLKKAGAEIVKEGVLSASLREALEKPLVPDAVYLSVVTELFARYRGEAPK